MLGLMVFALPLAGLNWFHVLMIYSMLLNSLLSLLWIF